MIEKISGNAAAAPVTEARLVGIETAAIESDLTRYDARLGGTQRRSFGRFLKDVALFFAAPFIGVVYMAALPMVGMSTVFGMGVRWMKARQAKN